jgi:hypothetical protein
MDEPEATQIKSVTPRREWLLRCSDSRLDLSVCCIGVASGTVEIVSPANDVISLCGSEIVDFHTALHQAIELAEADLRESA